MDTESHNLRMKEIQRRKAERRRKQIFKNRCIAAVFCLLLIVLMVFGIKSCVSNIAQKRAEKAQAEETVSPSPTPTPILTDSSGINQSYFEESVFLGNSFIDGMAIYDLVDGAEYYGKVGLNVKTAFTESTENGVVPVIEELNSPKNYKKIFLMFGENEMGWPSSQTFIDEYTRIVKKAKQYQPEATIYLLSVTPISEEVSEKGANGETNENVVKVNKLIKQVANEQKVVYANIYDAVADEDGALPKEAATDGIHFGNEYYKKSLIYIQEHYDEETIESITSSSGSSSSSSSNKSSSSSGSSSSSNKSSSSSGGSGSSSGSSSSSSNKSSSSSSSSSSNKSSSSSSSSSSSNKSSSSSGSSSSSNKSSSGSSSSDSSSSNKSSSSSSGNGSSSSSSNSSGSTSATKAPAKDLD